MQREREREREREEGTEKETYRAREKWEIKKPGLRRRGAIVSFTCPFKVANGSFSYSCCCYARACVRAPRMSNGEVVTPSSYRNRFIDSAVYMPFSFCAAWWNVRVVVGFTVGRQARPLSKLPSLLSPRVIITIGKCNRRRTVSCDYVDAANSLSNSFACPGMCVIRAR